MASTVGSSRKSNPGVSSSSHLRKKDKTKQRDTLQAPAEAWKTDVDLKVSSRPTHVSRRDKQRAYAQGTSLSPANDGVPTHTRRSEDSKGTPQQHSLALFSSYEPKVHQVVSHADEVKPELPFTEKDVMQAPPTEFQSMAEPETVEIPVEGGRFLKRGVYVGNLTSGGSRETLRFIADKGSKDAGFHNPVATTYFRINTYSEGRLGDGVSLLMNGGPHDGKNGANIHVTLPFEGGSEKNVQFESHTKEFTKSSMPGNFDVGPLLDRIVGLKVASFDNGDGTRTFDAYVDTSADQHAKPQGEWRPWLRFKAADTGNAWQTWLRTDGVSNMDVFEFKVGEAVLKDPQYSAQLTSADVPTFDVTGATLEPADEPFEPLGEITDFLEDAGNFLGDFANLLTQPLSGNGSNNTSNSTQP